MQNLLIVLQSGRDEEPDDVGVIEDDVVLTSGRSSVPMIVFSSRCASAVNGVSSGSGGVVVMAAPVDQFRVKGCLHVPRTLGGPSNPD